MLVEKKDLAKRLYSIVNKKDIYNKKEHFKYGWSHNPLDVLNYFYDQKSLPSDKRAVGNGEYVVLFHDMDSGAFGYAAWGNDPAYKQRVHTMA
jgi:hypothetical protein